MENRTVMILVIMISAIYRSGANLNVIPRDTEAKINETTFFNCSTTLLADQIQWRHDNKIVYTGVAILEPYNDGRFSIEINASIGSSNLVIRSVRPSDAGRYECADDEGAGDQRSVQLIVLDTDPLCKSNMDSDGIIGPNSCSIEPEEVKFSCSITYHGNIPPVLQWKTNGSSQSLADGTVTINENKVTKTLTISSTLDLNNASFICETTRASETQYSCSTNRIKIIYVSSSVVRVNITLKEEVTCVANSSQSCKYKWQWFDGDDSITESDNQILKPRKAGMHRCVATCSIGHRSCTVEPMYADVYPDSMYLEKSVAGGIAGLVVFLVSIVLLVTAAIVTIYCYRKKPGHPEVYKSNPAFVKTIRIKSRKKENREIRGIAILERELFVCNLSPSVDVYDSEEFCFRRRWDLPESFRAQDMVSCSRNKCLYINGYTDKSQPSKILRVNKNGNLINEWSTGYDWGWGLSVTSESNIILAVSEKHKLNEYSPDGVLIQTISPSENASISYPWHALKLTDGDFVVSHGNYRVARPRLHSVCKIDSAGAFKKTYLEKCGVSIGQMNRPVYLCVDTKNECVMVVDRSNSRVLLLDSELTFQSQILSKNGKHGLRDPSRILFDESNDRLFVVDNESNKQRISIFNLKMKERGTREIGLLNRL